jgi:Kef-type K+ transport system membrane component KefB
MLDALKISFEPNVLATIGLIIVVAFLGSKIFQRYRIPQVVGFIVMGVILGPSLLNIVPLELSNELVFISEIALGLIGFDIGSHLLLRELRALGRSLILILIFEALGTFVLVATGIYFITRSWPTALIFGALSSATDPAATVDVLAEYDAKGPLTTSLLAVVGMDDGLALLLYSISAATVESLFSNSETLLLTRILELPLIEMGGSVLLGLSIGLLLDTILYRMKRYHDAMAVSIGFVLLSVGLSQALGLSLILTSMVLGMVVVNRHSDHSLQIRYTIEQAGPVIYVLFFALVGSRFLVSNLPAMGLLGLGYIILRIVGKISGAWTGGRIGRALPVVRSNLGLGLLSQAGVAVGLALSTAQRFERFGPPGQELGHLVIAVIACTTFLAQIIGPIGVKFAIGRAGEIGLARLEHDAWASEGAPE